MVDFFAIEKKWQQKWDQDKVFQVEVSDFSKKKYYLTTPYPYMSGILHLGHLFTYNAPETIARFKRMQGYNVLFKFGFHCTGTPIVAAAARVKEKEPTQIETLRKMGIADKEISKFADPNYWIEYFPKETLRDLKGLGFAIDERYTFRTTPINPPYDAFVTWQFNKLKEKGYVRKGKHPVMWCPKDNVPVGDHDRSEGEGETPQEFLLFKHKLDDGRFVISATLRQDTVLGITNLFVHPDLDYVEATVNGEQWILAEKAALALPNQGFTVKVGKKIKGKDLIGKKTTEFDDSKVLILLATFLDPNVGTGLVHSVPSDSADDLIALLDLQKDDATLKKYGLDMAAVRSIKPIPVLNTPELGDVPAKVMLERYKVTSQKDKAKLLEIKQELYKLSHYTAIFNDRYKKAFSKNLSGKNVHEGKELIKDELIAKKFAVKYYEPTGRVVCRCLTPCVVKIVDNQWFIEYNDPAWKKITHDCLHSMTIYPEKIRKQFDYVLDWLDHWACTREFGLGTVLPWDRTWKIESLSDSTLQMAYCTIAKYLQDSKKYGFDAHRLNDAFFDYVFLGSGKTADVVKATGVPAKLLEQMKAEFEYWYPFDFRNSAKDLLQNHLAFCLFNHTAIFPPKHWPRAYVLNGRVMVNGEKMSKSKGNFYTMRELYAKHGADVVRLTAAYAGEGVEDANYDMTFLETAKNKLNDISRFITDTYNKGRTNPLSIDEWFMSMINLCVRKTTDALGEMLFKSAIQASLMDMQRYLKWYTRRTNGEYNKKVINQFIETQLLLLTPFTPHFCEEQWSTLGKKGYISNAPWPTASSVDEKAGLGEELIEQTMTDVQRVLQLAKLDKATSITLFVADDWKHTLYTELGKTLAETRDFKTIMTSILANKQLKEHAADISKILPKIIQIGNVPTSTSQKFELTVLTDARSFLENEYGCAVKIVKESDSKELKARQAMPGKVAIVVE